MEFHWNFFRFIADICHAMSKCILLGQIHINHSAEGVSLLTQSFYLVLFCCRYLPFTFSQAIDSSSFHAWWNIFFKSFYILSSAYTLVAMLFIFARTRERESAWKLGGIVFAGSLALAPFVMMIFRDRATGSWSVAENSWIFSTILESVAVLPQLQLLRQTDVPTVIDSWYLYMIGTYRFFYILNWIVKGVEKRTNPNIDIDPVSVIFGVIQTLIYFDFFWVYYSRQRVKLRHGQVGDCVGLSNGWLVKRLIGKQKPSGIGEAEDEEQANGQARAGTRRGWGPRGISVSADVGVHDGSSEAHDETALTAPEAFEDDLDDDAEPTPKPASLAAETDGSEWLDNDHDRDEGHRT